MSKEQSDTQKKGNKNNVVQLNLNCVTDDCNSRSKRMNFCEEHFEWFKIGLITKDGKKPKDFDKKYFAFLRKKAA